MHVFEKAVNPKTKSRYVANKKNMCVTHLWSCIDLLINKTIENILTLRNQKEECYSKKHILHELYFHFIKVSMNEEPCSMKT